jgi:hypothetical protein
MFAKANKHSRFTHVGLRLWKTPNDHQVLIVHIDDHSIFARSGLKVGMKIDRINKLRPKQLEFGSNLRNSE